MRNNLLLPIKFGERKKSYRNPALDVFTAYTRQKYFAAELGVFDFERDERAYEGFQHEQREAIEIELHELVEACGKKLESYKVPVDKSMMKGVRLYDAEYREHFNLPPLAKVEKRHKKHAKKADTYHPTFPEGVN